MKFHFNSIKNHVLLNKLAVDEAERNFLSRTNTNDTYISKLYNSLQGKAAEMYLVENSEMHFLDDSTVQILKDRDDYWNIAQNLIYHDLIKDDKIIEVKAYSELNIDEKIDKTINTIKSRTWNFSDYLIVFKFDNWNYELYKKIKI